ncbi:MAG: penicillin acylase family protein [FCB group bacterium]|jgi:acyl-homoserine-lactone acylase|nr:penicillin acylase family protein [FCB group bacterium]
MHYRRPCLAAITFLALSWGAASAQENDPYAAWTEATIYRDDWGVPHVYAQTPRAMAFAFGFAQAEDHLEAMLLAYRAANGRAAEVLGEAYAASDEFALKMGHALLAQEAIKTADQVTLDLCEGFAQGVNAWLVQNADRAPAWADGVRPADILALLHSYLMGLAPYDMPGEFRPRPPAYTGNAWAVSPVRSSTGEAMLVLNPHMYFDGPFRWYEAHLVCQDLNMSGATLFGLPVILQGHNEHLGWALTPNRPDFADVYAQPEFTVPRDPKSVNTPQFDPEVLLKLEMAQRARAYYVMTDSGLEERQAICMITNDGPVIGEDRGRLCTYRIGGYGTFGALRQFVEMGRAQDLATFQAVWAQQQVPCFHVVYADRDGNIFYLYNTVVGEKASVVPSGNEDQPTQPINWNAPLAREITAYGWGNTIPTASLPAILNPASGYVQACGNPPWLATDESGMNPGAFPPWFSLDEDTFRARRARHLLRLGARTFDEMQAMLYDSLPPFALDAVPALFAAAEENQGFVDKAHPDLPVSLDLLRTWSYAAETDSTGMTFFHVWWMLLQEALAPRFASPVQLMDAVGARTPELQEIMLQAASEAAKRMRNEYQNISEPWGDVHRIVRGEKEMALAGGDAGDPIFYNSDLRLQDSKWTANYGYGYAMVVRFGETPEAVSMSPFGQSELPDSPHFDDQMDLMAQRRYKPAYFTMDDVLLHAKGGFGRSIEFRPAGMDGRIQVRTPVPVFAQIESTATPPLPLPDGFGTYSVYAAVRDLPEGLPTAMTVEIRISDDLCDTDRLDRLGVYACDGEGWQRLEEQELNTETGIFSARDDRARMYAVLGPAEFLKTEDAPKPVVPAPRLSKREYEGILAAARDRMEEDVTPDDMVAGTPPPLVPSGTILSEPEKVEVAKADPGVPAPAETSKTEPVAPSPAPAAEVPKPMETAKLEPTAPQASKPLVITNEEVARAEAAAAAKPAAAPQAEEAVTPLRDMKPLAVGPPASGKDLAVWTPDMKSMFLFSAKMNAEARLVTLPQAPKRLPEGMAAFSPYLGLERIPEDVKGSLAMKIVVTEGSCAPENLTRLRLYGYDENKGWFEAEGQNTDPKDNSVSALDYLGKDLRVYAILGPAEYRKK